MFNITMENWVEQLPWFALFLVLTYVIRYILTRPKNFPPGPSGLPIIGYLPYLGKKPHLTITKLREKYGDIFSINIFGSNMVVLSSYKLIKDALVKQGNTFADRPDIMLVPEFKSTPGVGASNGAQWAAVRHYSISTFRDFGMGKTSLEPQIQDEINHLLETFTSFKGQPEYLSKYLRRSITNVILILLTGKRYDYKDKTFISLLDTMRDIMKNIGINNFLELLPEPLRFQKLFKMIGIKTATNAMLDLTEDINKIVRALEPHYHPSKSKENFIYAWMSQSEKPDPNNYLSKEQMPAVLMDFFLAGSDTTTNTLSWALLYLAKHPDVQKKVQQEIDDVIGRERTPAMTDQKVMPYAEATIMEAQRLASIVPLSVLRCTREDTSLAGYSIPNKTIIMPNLWAIHHDPEIFPEPFRFNPDRFIAADGSLKRPDELIPFGLGKRQCLGESLARMELFLYFTNMLQHFTFKPAEGAEITLEYEYSIILEPNEQKLRAIPR